MSDFPDVEQFAQQHMDCGGITPSAAPRAAGGYVLTLTCACGAIHTRVITLEEARKPLPLPRPRVAPAGGPRPPAPPPPATTERRAGPSADVAAALRAALEAEEAAAAAPPSKPAPPPPPTKAGGGLDDVIAAALAAEEAAEAAPPAAPAAAKPAGPQTPAGRQTPDRLNLDATIRKALDRQKQQAEAVEDSAPPPSRARTVVLVLMMFLLVGGLSFVFLGGLADEPPEMIGGAPAGPQLEGEQRAALQAVVTSLRQVQASTPPDASYPAYSSRVLVAKSDVERYVSGPSAPARSVVREMMDLHLLANAALRAKALEDKDALEPVGKDPAVEYCAEIKPGLDAAAAANGMTVEQARGAAVVAAVPQLFECARQRLADLERLLGPR